MFRGHFCKTMVFPFKSLSSVVVWLLEPERNVCVSLGRSFWGRS